MILSAGREINDVNTDANVATKLSLYNFDIYKYLSTSSAIIYFDANWPMLINATLNIVILIPVHKAGTPYSIIILRNASKVFL